MARIRHLALNPADESSTNIPRRARGSIIHGPATRRAAVVAFIFCALAITLALVPHRGRQATALVWEADFNGRPGAAPSAQQWDVIRGGGGWGHHELQTYDPGPHTVALTGSGLLGITAQRSTSAATDAVTYSSGRVESRTFRLSGAVVSARLRTPPGQGLWPAFWLSSEAPDHPATVELDAMEAIGRQPRTLYGTAHRGADGRSCQALLGAGASSPGHAGGAAP
jgi:hypothetical protein